MERNKLMDRKELLTAFRDTMSQVAATVYAITTCGENGGGEGTTGGTRHGILATAVSSLSFDSSSAKVASCDSISPIRSLRPPVAC